MINQHKYSDLSLPNAADKLLLHSCCAPCSGSLIERLSLAKIDFTIFFYNPNIHPQREYEIRKEENMRFAKKMNVPFIDADYDRDAWFKRVKGLSTKPERGQRCSVCFDMRFERTALYAHENNFKVFASSLGIARCKDLDQVMASGQKAAQRYPQLTYWANNWRKNGGVERMCEITQCENFYRQEYCGCAYSLRDANHWRIKQGREPIKNNQPPANIMRFNQ
jgi:predicted adenine nucleotide alpha hydrolase (AANH) superfamily ATPase